MVSKGLHTRTINAEFAETAEGELGVEETDDLFNRDAAALEVLERVPSTQCRQTGPVRGHIIEPFGTRSSIRSAHDQHVATSTVV